MIIYNQVAISNTHSIDKKELAQYWPTSDVAQHPWYYKILSCGKPDLVAITILSELVLLHHKNGGREFNRGYKYFQHKFNFTKVQIKYAILRLQN